MVLELSGRKEIIFDAAVALFAQKGYENVSMRTVAQNSGIRVSSIYNHFASKGEILEAIYQYFIDHMFDSSLTVEELRRSGHETTLTSIMQAANWSFRSLPPKMFQRMNGINRLIYTRMLHDLRANQVFREHLLKRHKKRRKEVFEYARALGLIASEADIDELAELLVFVRLMITIVGLARTFAGERFNAQDDPLGQLMMKLLEGTLRPTAAAGGGAPAEEAEAPPGRPGPVF